MRRWSRGAIKLASVKGMSAYAAELAQRLHGRLAQESRFLLPGLAVLFNRLLKTLALAVSHIR
jgi:hypothetical protein